MMPMKEDLGLSLSLGSPKNYQHPKLNLMPSVSQWSDLLASSQEKRQSPEATRPMLKVIDVNRAPAAESKKVKIFSPNSALSSVSRKRDHVLTISSDSGGGEGFSDEEDGDGSRKKLRLSKDQSAVLEETFNEHNSLNPVQKQALAKQLNLRPRQVEVWFQNRRARIKLKQTEVECEFLKRCCANLTSENQRLNKKVGELRALKLSLRVYMHMTLPTMLTMCPSCEPVTTPNNGGGATTSSSLQDNAEHRFLQHAHQL